MTLSFETSLARLAQSEMVRRINEGDFNAVGRALGIQMCEVHDESALLMKIQKAAQERDLYDVDDAAARAQHIAHWTAGMDDFSQYQL